jgi:metal-responsive CopG/Arc/MetJ family transcriptional regulator
LCRSSALQSSTNWSYSPNGRGLISEKKENGKKGNRARQRILLSETEARKVDFAVGESGALSRSLFISEAIRAGLESFDAANVEGKRNRRVDAWTPSESIDAVKRLADAFDLTQQSILRYMILRYVDEAQWRHPLHSGAATATQPPGDDRQ